ncbi:IS3 family transposase [Anaerobacillus sp. HL2]|nr:IS3 family transposase [Anaerobacillus sp. HL2]
MIYLIHAELRDEYNIPLNLKVVRRLMSELGFKSQAKKEKTNLSVEKIKTWFLLDSYVIYKRDFSTTKLSEKWVTDITTIIVGHHKFFCLQ